MDGEIDEFEELEAAEARERARPPRIWKPRKPCYWWSGMTGAEILASAQVTLTAEEEN